jgi:hypothetical protein
LNEAGEEILKINGQNHKQETEKRREKFVFWLDILKLIINI